MRRLAFAVLVCLVFPSGAFSRSNDKEYLREVYDAAVQHLDRTFSLPLQTQTASQLEYKAAVRELKKLLAHAEEGDESSSHILSHFAEGEVQEAVMELADSEGLADLENNIEEFETPDLRRLGAFAFANNPAQSIAAYKELRLRLPTDLEASAGLTRLYVRLDLREELSGISGELIISKEPILQTYGLVARGIVLSRNGDLNGAKSAFEAAETIASRNRLTARQAAIQSNLASTADALGDLPAATKLHTRSMKLSRRVGDFHGVIRSLGSLASIADDMGDLQAACSYWGAILENAKKIGPHFNVAAWQAKKSRQKNCHR